MDNYFQALAACAGQRESKMTQEAYLRLRNFLDEQPGGFPATPQGLELKILEKLFTPQQAEAAVKLGASPQPLAQAARRLEMDEEAAAALLGEMHAKGLVQRARIPGRGDFYMAAQFVIGIYEFQLGRIDRELAELMEEYLPYLHESWTSIKTGQLRVVPVGMSVDTAKPVAPYDQVRALVEQHDLFSVSACICRVEKALVEKPCDRPEETCLQFGFAAQYYIERGMGRAISKEEVYQVLERAEEAALVLSPTNAQKIMNICCCCACCCAVLGGLAKLEKPAEHVQSSFYASIDEGLCSGCGVCMDRCQMAAISDGGGFSVVNPDRCIGCGLCVSTCPEEAVSLLPKPEAKAPPRSATEMNRRILAERGFGA